MFFFYSNQFAKVNFHSATVCPFTLLGNKAIIIKHNHTEEVEMFENSSFSFYNGLS